MINVIKAYASPQEAVRSVKINKKPLLDYTTNYATKLYENGFYAVVDPYVCGDNRIIFNRSRGAESNFFAILETGASSVEVYFTDPRSDESAFSIKKDDVIVNFKYGGGVLRLVFGGYGNPTKGFETAEKTIEFSKMKAENEYRCYLHSHLGHVNVNGKEESIWGDGRTSDKNWILHTILAHGDVHALTEHNWTQNEERLGALKERLDAANIVFVPGWENTTTAVNLVKAPEDLVQAPHILCYCANIDTAMTVKHEFLIKKLKKDVPITPIFCGVPVPFDEHIAFMKKYHDQGLLGVIIAHPFSTLPGIDLFDPANISRLGIDKIKDTFRFADGVEMYNGAEGHSQLNLDVSEKKKNFKSGYSYWLMKELEARGIAKFLSAPNLNYLMGKMAEEQNKHTIYGQDDHQLWDIGPDCVSLYNQGHTKITIPEKAFQTLKSEGRKVTSEELVHAISKGTLKISDEKITLEAFAFAKITDKGPAVIDARKKTAVGKIIDGIRAFPYYTNVAKLTLQHWYAKYILKDEKKIEEIAKELEKEKTYNLKP